MEYTDKIVGKIRRMLYIYLLSTPRSLMRKQTIDAKKKTLYWRGTTKKKVSLKSAGPEEKKKLYLGKIISVKQYYCSSALFCHSFPYDLNRLEKDYPLLPSRKQEANLNWRII